MDRFDFTIYPTAATPASDLELRVLAALDEINRHRRGENILTRRELPKKEGSK